MPDAWTLVTPAGPYELNPSFTAPQYEPGGVSGPGALRRDDRTTYQRSGDGLRTPGALTLVGRVWRDDHNHALMVSELNAIRNAVSACTSVTRVNNAGTYTYDFVAGGATPEITPDGLGGWLVRLDLWPGRAEPTFAPIGPSVQILAASVEIISHTSGGPLTIPLPTTAPPGALILLALNNDPFSGDITQLDGWTNLNAEANLNPLLDTERVRVWGFTRVTNAPENSINLTSGSLWGTAHITIATGASGIADVHVTDGDIAPVAVTGTATETGLQVLMGGVIEFFVG